MDLRNNVFYNWGPTNGGYAGEGGSYNFVNNYYKPGPSTATKESLVNRIFQPNADDGSQKNVKGIWGTFYVSGNHFDNTCPAIQNHAKKSKVLGLIEAVNADNWEGIQPNTNNGDLPDGKIDNIRSNTEFAVEAVGTHTAADAYDRVLAYAGASLKRDAVDTRIVSDVQNGTYEYEGSNGSSNGLIDSQADAGGWPAYQSTTKPQDSDNDGIPDEWAARNLPEGKTYRDLDPTSGYSYLELYINSLVADIMKGGCEGSSGSPCSQDF